MRIIGITGGIGTGKTKVLNILHDNFGAYIVEADKVAHQLMLPGNEIYKELVSCFGEEILTEAKEVDRQKLSGIVMNDETSLQKLNSIVHPGVKAFIRHDIEEKKAQDVEYYIIEAALLIQDNYKEICDEIWAVTADLEIRISRLEENRGFTKEKALKYIKNQPVEAFYSSNSDAVIVNNGAESDLIKSIDDLLHVC